MTDKELLDFYEHQVVDVQIRDYGKRGWLVTFSDPGKRRYVGYHSGGLRMVLELAVAYHKDAVGPQASPLKPRT